LGAAGVEGGVEEVRRGYAERLEGLPEPELVVTRFVEEMVARLRPERYLEGMGA
jgi:hypothetical protein